MPVIKKPALKLHLNEKNVKLFVDLLRKQRAPFKMQISNYTTKIISEHHNVTFVKSMQSNRVFAAAAFLKNDLKNVPPPGIDMKKNCYYDTNFKGVDFYSDVAFNIDIKHAYANILFNEKFISEKTFKYLSGIPKQDRLAAVGMLASRKVIFEHGRDGKIYNFTEDVNPLSNFFFYCVQKTENIIHDIKNKILKESFLFSWVDGLYYLNDNKAYQAVTQEYLQDEYGLNSSYKELREFEVKTKNSSYRISFKENDNLKTFNIPFPEMEFKKQICDYLLTKNYKKNEPIRKNVFKRKF